jgi:hypothetical protein
MNACIARLLINIRAVQPLLAEMSRINNNGWSKTVEQKTKAQKALGEQIIALTHRERPYMAMLFPLFQQFVHLLRINSYTKKFKFFYR